MSDEVDMADNERKFEATVYCMSREKRDKLRRKLDRIDMVNAVTSVSFPSLSAETMSEEVEEGSA